MDGFEMAQALMGQLRAGAAAGNASQMTAWVGVAMEDSKDGVVPVDLGGDTVSEDENQAVEVYTTVDVREEDEVIVVAVGATGTAKELIVAGVVGGGDRTKKEVQAIKNYFWADDYGAHISTEENSVAGKNVLLDSDSLDIREGASNNEDDQTVFASFGREVTIGSRNPSAGVGAFSQVYGVSCEASGAYSYSQGYHSIASGAYSHAEGGEKWYFNTPYRATASGECSHAEGVGAVASGTASHAEGFRSIASGYGSHAEGGAGFTAGSSADPPPTASGTFSHAEGTKTTASGSASHAEGNGTTASEKGCHAEGYHTKANADNSTEGTLHLITDGKGWSHAEGFCSTAKASGAHAEGWNTIAASEYQHVSGKHNVEDSNSVYAEIIGNGVSTTARSNARTLDWSGNEWLAGNLDADGNVNAGGDVAATGNVSAGGGISSTGDATIGGGATVGSVPATSDDSSSVPSTEWVHDAIKADVIARSVSVSNVSVPASGTVEVEADVARTGYTPIGIIGLASTGTGSTSCVPVEWTASASDNKATATIRNLTGTARTITVTFRVLYVKS